MIGLDRQQAVENLRRFLLPGVGLVGRRVVGHAENREGVEDRGLVVVGVALAHARHRLFVGHDARRMRHRIALVVGGDASDVVALTGARRAQGRRLLRRRSSCSEFALRRRPPDGVEVRHRDAPLRQAAIWILRRNLLEHRRRLGVGEGMQKRQAALEGRLNLPVARGWKADLAELLWRDVRVIMFVLGECPARHQRQGSRHELTGTEGPHGSPLRRRPAILSRSRRAGTGNSLSALRPSRLLLAADGA